MARPQQTKPFDVSEALREAARRRREQAEIDCQRLAQKLAVDGTLSDEELQRVETLIRDGLECGAFERAVMFLSDVPALEKVVASFDFEGHGRTMAALTADFARQVDENRAAEAAAAQILGDARLRGLSASTAAEKLAGIKARYPHANL